MLSVSTEPRLITSIGTALISEGTRSVLSEFLEDLLCAKHWGPAMRGLTLRVPRGPPGGIVLPVAWVRRSHLVRAAGIARPFPAPSPARALDAGPFKKILSPLSPHN